MINNQQNLFYQPVRDEWVRLRTFIYLRWLAVFGQSGAVIAGFFFLNLSLRLDLIFSLVLLSVSINIMATLLYPENKRLTEKDIMLLLMYDLIQLGILLFLTGGLTNPFSVLVLAPVVISATALRLGPTLILGFIATTLITILGFFYLPLKTLDNLSLDPDILLIGAWLALLITVIFLGSYARRVTVEISLMNEALLATQMALEREQKLTALGGVVAAMGHELGTPLSTIKLVATEILNDKNIILELKEDIQLVNSQVDRCRDILHDMGRRGKDDTHMHIVPILSLIQEATEPHQKRGKTIFLKAGDYHGIISDGIQIESQPNLHRRSEVIHGIRNLVQNAVDFAKKNVFINVEWSKETISIKISDDGAGFHDDMIGRLGDPFISQKFYGKIFKRQASKYEGMGLGLFIAKTLLERTGARLVFSNGKIKYKNSNKNESMVKQHTNSGAIVEVMWPINLIAVSEYDARLPLEPNLKN